MISDFHYSVIVAKIIHKKRINIFVIFVETE